MLTTEHPNHHLSVTRALLFRRNTSAMTCGVRGTKGNPVQIRCGRATVIGETLSRWHLFDVAENHCLPSADGKVESRRYQPLARKPAFGCVLAALRGTSEADLPVHRACLTKAIKCLCVRPVHQVRTGFFTVSSIANSPRAAEGNPHSVSPEPVRWTLWDGDVHW